MQPAPNRLGLGMRPPAFPIGQGPSMGALAQQQMSNQFVSPQAQKLTTLFVGSISGGITDHFLNQLLVACGPVKSFKRLITPANKPQGFGFAEFEDPDSMTRAVALLNGVELPALEEGCANKKLLVKADEKTKRFMDAYNSQRMKTDADDKAMATAHEKIHALIDSLSTSSAALTDSSKERYVIPPHLHDLQEADLPEEQRGLVVSEIALFRERAAKREREKLRDERERNLTAFGANSGGPPNGGGMSRGAPPNAPSGPKERVWGRPSTSAASPQGRQQSFGSGVQGYSKPVGFVKSEEGADGGHMNGHNGDRAASARPQKSDLELENERKEVRRRNEEQSFRDRERRYEPRERNRISALEHTIRHEQAVRNAQALARADLKARLAAWDDSDSDETFYTDRLRWRASRRRRLDAEEEADRVSREYEERQAEYLRMESEQFLEKQLKDMQSLAEEQRKAGLLLDDGAPVKLSVALKLDTAASNSKSAPDVKAEPKNVMWNNDDDEDDASTRRRKVPLVKLDFSVAEGGTEKVRDRLEKIKESISKEPASLFKMSVRWDGMNDILIDRKLEPLIRRKMTDFLGELDDDDLIMFVVEHLKDHRGPAKLVEGLEPVLLEEASDFVVHLWRQIVFESMAYADGINTGSEMID